MDDAFEEKKYSKISPALKSYFLHSLYFKTMTIKEAAAKCKLNYSTAKVIIRDLSQKERRFVKRIIKERELQEKRNGYSGPLQCSYRQVQREERSGKDINDSDTCFSTRVLPLEVISRTSFDFFAKDDLKE